VNNMVASVRENAMRSLVAAVFSVATLLSVSSSAFAQGAQPWSCSRGRARRGGTFASNVWH